MNRALATVETGTEGLVYYEQARIALEMARTADEVNHIRGGAEAARAAARVYGNRDLEINAAEIRIRALRRLGELLVLQKQTVGFRTGQFGSDHGGSESEPPATLDEMGVGKKVSMEAQNLASVEPEKFEEKIIHWRRKHEDGKSRVTLSLYHTADAPMPHRPFSSQCPAPSPPVDGEPLQYHHLVWVFIKKRESLGLSQAAYDDLVGWEDSETSKYEIPHRDTGRIASGQKVCEWAHGLGIKLVPLSGQ